MRLLVFADLHGSKKGLKSLILKAKKADVIICAGDFTIFGNGQKDILSKLNKIGKKVLGIHGNHEELYNVRKDARDMKNIEVMHGKKFKFNGVSFIGWGGGGLG